MPRPRADAPVKLLTDALIADVRREVEQRERRRQNFNFHPSLDDNPHRFLNVMLRDTYVAPHRHLNPHKAESFIVLRGSVLCYLFDDDGEVTQVYRLGEPGSGAPAQGIDLAPGQWHTLVVDGDYAAIYEVKPGPYEPSQDKQFAPWAPQEGEPGCTAYLLRLLVLASR